MVPFRRCRLTKAEEKKLEKLRELDKEMQEAVEGAPQIQPLLLVFYFIFSWFLCLRLRAEFPFTVALTGFPQLMLNGNYDIVAVLDSRPIYKGRKIVSTSSSTKKEERNLHLYFHEESEAWCLGQYVGSNQAQA